MTGLRGNWGGIERVRSEKMGGKLRKKRTEREIRKNQEK